MSPGGFKRSIPLNSAQLAELLEQIEKLDQHEARTERDGDAGGGRQRLCYQNTEIPLTVEHPGGGVGRFLVCSRNISPQGISLIHGGYLHADSRCEIGLANLWGATETVFGTLATCRHLTGAVHDLDVEFDVPVDLRHFIASDDLLPFTAEGIDPASIAGAALYLDDQEVECKLLAHFLRETRIKLATFTEPGPALDQLKRHPFDIVLCDLDLKEMAGEQVIQAIRSAPYAGPVIVLTGESDTTRLRNAEDAGANAILKKPYSAQQILALLHEWLCGDSDSGEPIYSAAAGEPGMAELLETYLSHVSQTIHNMKKAMAEDNIGEVRSLCQMLNETGGGYGFAPLSEAAQEAVTALDSSSSITESIAALQRVEVTTKRLERGVQPRRAT